MLLLQRQRPLVRPGPSVPPDRLRDPGGHTQREEEGRVHNLQVPGKKNKSKEGPFRSGRGGKTRVLCLSNGPSRSERRARGAGRKRSKLLMVTTSPSGWVFRRVCSEGEAMGHINGCWTWRRKRKGRSHSKPKEENAEWKKGRKSERRRPASLYYEERGKNSHLFSGFLPRSVGRRPLTTLILPKCLPPLSGRADGSDVPFDPSCFSGFFRFFLSRRGNNSCGSTRANRGISPRKKV